MRLRPGHARLRLLCCRCAAARSLATHAHHAQPESSCGGIDPDPCLPPPPSPAHRDIGFIVYGLGKPLDPFLQKHYD